MLSELLINSKLKGNINIGKFETMFGFPYSQLLTCVFFGIKYIIYKCTVQNLRRPPTLVCNCF